MEPTTETITPETSSTSEPIVDKQTTTESTSVETTETGANTAEPKTPEQVVQGIVDAAYPTPGKEEKKEVAAGKTASSPTTTTTTAKPNPSVVPEVVDSTKQGDERYDKIPRFKELIDWKKTHEPLVEKAKGLSQWQQSTGVNDQELEEAKTFLAAIKTGDYNKAHGMLAPLVGQLQTLVGEVLPKDLQTAVDEGKISVDYAKELGRSRSTTQQTQHQMQRATQQSLSQQRSGAINSWVENVKKTDPDFDKKSDMVNQAFLIRWAQKQDASPAELSAFCQQAYDEVNGKLQAFIPRPPERKLPTSNGSTTFKEVEPKDPYERAMSIVNKAYSR